MKKRLISVAVGLTLLAVVMLWYDTVLAPIVFILLGLLAIYEVLRALGIEKNYLLLLTFWAAHVIQVIWMPDPHYCVYLLLILTFTIAMTTKKHPISFKSGAAAFTVMLMITMGFGSIVRMRSSCPLKADQLFMLFIGLALGWMCDTFAFTFGKLFGKRKLCPSISPNKTIEGAVGGVLGTIVFILAAMLLYVENAPNGSVFEGYNQPVHVLLYALMGLVGSIVGILGDLAASFVKRECGIKDFGNIMPGHGGAMDRIDSVMFTSTFAALSFEILFQIGCC